MDEKNRQSDHDLLITLNVRVQDLIDTIKRMEGVTTSDIGGLKECKLDKTDFATHEANNEKDLSVIFADIKTHSRMLWIGIGLITALQFAVPFILKLI